jgi:hypothetical protein
VFTYSRLQTPCSSLSLCVNTKCNSKCTKNLMAHGMCQLKVRLTVKCCLTKISHKNNYKILELGDGLCLLLHHTSIIKPSKLRGYVVSSRMRDVKTEGAVM